MVNTNHLFLRPPMNNIANVIIIYIITAPVSGSMNVRVDGMNKTRYKRSIQKPLKIMRERLFLSE